MRLNNKTDCFSIHFMTFDRFCHYFNEFVGKQFFVKEKEEKYLLLIHLVPTHT